MNYIPAPNCFGNCPNPQGIYFQSLLGGGCPPSHPNSQMPVCPPPVSNLPGITSTFTANMTSGLNSYGCSFLYSRNGVLQSRLNGLISAGTNPLWQQMLQNRINYIMNLALQNCTGGPTPPPMTGGPANPPMTGGPTPPPVKGNSVPMQQSNTRNFNGW